MTERNSSSNPESLAGINDTETVKSLGSNALVNAFSDSIENGDHKQKATPNQLASDRITREDVELKVSGIKLGATLVKAPGDNNPGVLVLSGGGNFSRKEGYTPGMQNDMAAMGLNSVALDYRGIEGTGVELSDTSLETRLEDAREALRLLDTEDLYIAGVSMGAPLAIRLANEVGAKGILLLAPAAYSAEANNLNFGPDFTDVLRKPNSWEDSLEFEDLKKFSGRVILAYGGEDTVVPAPVFEAYAAAASGKGRVLSFENVGHRFMRESDAASIGARADIYDAFNALLEKTNHR